LVKREKAIGMILINYGKREIPILLNMKQKMIQNNCGENILAACVALIIIKAQTVQIYPAIIVVESISVINA